MDTRDGSGLVRSTLQITKVMFVGFEAIQKFRHLLHARVVDVFQGVMLLLAEMCEWGFRIICGQQAQHETSDTKAVEQSLQVMVVHSP